MLPIDAFQLSEQAKALQELSRGQEQDRARRDMCILSACHFLWVLSESEKTQDRA